MSAAATYLALADLIESHITALLPGARVPSEHELAAAHDVNRLTARAALQELERRYLVRRVRGVGTFVADRIEYRIGPGTPPSLTATISSLGIDVAQRNRQVRSTRAPAHVRDGLGVARATIVERVTEIGGEPVAASTSWLVPALVPHLSSVLPACGSLFGVLHDHYRLRPERQWTRAELEVVPSDVARALGLDGRPVAWSLLSVNRSAAADRPLEVSASWLRADLFRVVFELGGP